MATLHGWINGVSFDANSHDLVIQLNTIGYVTANLVSMNGQVGCQFFIDHNHFTNSSFKDLFSFIEALLKNEHNRRDMHGLLYLMDDESIYGLNWQVFVIRKGEIYQEKDIYLSPSREKIGDYY